MLSFDNPTASNLPPLNLSVMVGDAGSKCSIPLPANSSYLRINGTVDYRQGTVTFRLSPPPPVAGFSMQVNTRCPSPNADVSPLYETPLDPAVVYNLSMSVGQDGPVGIDSVLVYSGLEWVSCSRHFSHFSDPNWASYFGLNSISHPGDSTTATQGPPSAGASSK